MMRSTCLAMQHDARDRGPSVMERRAAEQATPTAAAAVDQKKVKEAGCVRAGRGLRSHQYGSHFDNGWADCTLQCASWVGAVRR